MFDCNFITNSLLLLLNIFIFSFRFCWQFPIFVSFLLIISYFLFVFVDILLFSFHFCWQFHIFVSFCWQFILYIDHQLFISIINRAHISLCHCILLIMQQWVENIYCILYYFDFMQTRQKCYLLLKIYISNYSKL